MEHRLHSAADAILEIDDGLKPSGEEAAPPARVSRWNIVVPWVIALASVAAVAMTLSRSQAPPPAGLTKLTVPLPEALVDLGRPAIAVSPDGSLVGFVGQRADTSVVYLRPVDGFEAAPVACTEGAVSLFFSPDGEWVGFYAGDRLKKVSTRGGPPLTLAGSRDFLGASWGPGARSWRRWPVAISWRFPTPAGYPQPSSIGPPPMFAGACCTFSPAAGHSC